MLSTAKLSRSFFCLMSHSLISLSSHISIPSITAYQCAWSTRSWVGYEANLYFLTWRKSHSQKLWLRDLMVLTQVIGNSSNEAASATVCSTKVCGVTVSDRDGKAPHKPIRQTAASQETCQQVFLGVSTERRRRKKISSSSRVTIIIRGEHHETNT